IVGYTKSYMAEQHSIDPIEVHYFNGISDLSYVTYDSHDDRWETYRNNTRVCERTYTVSFDEMHKLQAPFINIGPFGKDAHKLTERLHKKSAFQITPELLEIILKKFFWEA